MLKTHLKYSPNSYVSLLLYATLFGFLCVTKVNAEPHYFRDRGGVIYTMTNDATNNEIVLFQRRDNGQLRSIPWATVSTGGLGGSDNANIDPLGSQNALLFDNERKMLFAVNAGDNTITAFTTYYGGLLYRTALEPSGGMIPVSIAVSGDRLYVLNVGGSGSVTTFAIGNRGQLLALGSLELGLSNATEIPFDNVMAPGQIGVDALARRIIITHAGGQELLTAGIDDDGVAIGTLTSTPVPGQAPFSFDVSPFGNVMVTEAGSSSVSSFSPSALGRVLPINSESVATGQAATCWIVATDHFAYVTNTGANNISLFAHSRNGTLTLLEANAATATGAPTDMTLAGRNRFLYTTDAASGTISGFAIDPDNGQLSRIVTQSGLPADAGIQGIAAYDY